MFSGSVYWSIWSDLHVFLAPEKFPRKKYVGKFWIWTRLVKADNDVVTVMTAEWTRLGCDWRPGCPRFTNAGKHFGTCVILHYFLDGSVAVGQWQWSSDDIGDSGVSGERLQWWQW
jgi:hypothetical protein